MVIQLQNFLTTLEKYEKSAAGQKKLISEKNRLREIEEDLKDALAREDGMKTRIENMFKKLKETNEESDTLRKQLKDAKNEIDTLKKKLESSKSAEIEVLKKKLHD